MSTPRMTSTYSMLSLFRNCRKAAEYRYIIGLTPNGKDPNLYFGALIHDCLQLWHQHRDFSAVIALIDRACAARAADESVQRDWHLARAMMTGYAARYPREEFEIVALEKTFEGPIVNPATGASSRSFTLAGKVDGIVRIGDAHYILEHKTAATIDGDYLERLWTDFQITIYSHYVEQALGIPITGVIYNVLGKARLQQSKGETEEEYLERRAELIEKSKTGKSTAKRKMPEADEEFQARLAEKYANPEMFHREKLYLSRDRFDVLRAELWELSKAFLDARTRRAAGPLPGRDGRTEAPNRRSDREREEDAELWTSRHGRGETDRVFQQADRRDCRHPAALEQGEGRGRGVLLRHAEAG